MRTTIDARGRIVVPRVIRDALGLVAGEELDVVEHDGRLEIAVVPTRLRLESVGGVASAFPDPLLPSLSAELVRKTLEQTRR